MLNQSNISNPLSLSMSALPSNSIEHTSKSVNNESPSTNNINNLMSNNVSLTDPGNITISAETRCELVLLLSNDQYIEKFETFDDFLKLIDGTMTEIYQLMLSMYHYQFKKYIQSKN